LNNHADSKSAGGVALRVRTQDAFGTNALYSNVTGSSNVALGDNSLFSNTTNNNTAVGDHALYSNTTGTPNSALGLNALQANTTGGDNDAFGTNALYSNVTGNSNTAFGNNTLQANTASNNTAVGYFALHSNTTGSTNSAVGLNALQANTSGYSNNAFGTNALYFNTTGNSSNALGDNALYSNTTGINNTATGDSALHANTSGNTSSAFGENTLYHNTTGNNNSAIGYQAGNTVLSGSNNTFLGYGADVTSAASTTLSNSTAIGNGAIVTASNQIVLGNSSVTQTLLSGNVGIGTSTPYSRLEVWGLDTASTSAFAVVNSASTTEFTVYDTGNATLAGSLVQNSDQRLKTNISDLDGTSSLAEINALNPVTFNWIDPAKSSVPQYGFIAQQVQSVLPNLVSVTAPTALTPDGTLSLNYIDLISPIVAAIQELDKEITSLASTVAGFAQHFVSNEVDTNKLCVQGTCVTGTQLATLLAAANQSASASASLSSSAANATDTPPIIQINGDNPAIVQVGASYSDLGATITSPQADLNLGIKSFVNGLFVSNIVLDTSAAATDTIDYVVTDSRNLTSTSTRTIIVEPAAIPPPPASSVDASSTAATSTTAS
jgi:hypothetical protein